MIEFRQGTTVTVKMGPFVDSSDGDTDESALSINQADIRLSKNGADFAQVHDDQGAAPLPYDEKGWYTLSLDATDVDTLGELLIDIHVSGALHAWREFQVVAQDYWDAKYVTGNFQNPVNLQISNSTLTIEDA